MICNDLRVQCDNLGLHESFLKLLEEHLKLAKDPETLVKKCIKRLQIHKDNQYLPLNDPKKCIKICTGHKLRTTVQMLKNKITLMQGPNILKKNNYEPFFCDILGWKAYNNRYYDAKKHDYAIEFKKGQAGMWFDMVRYAEIYLKQGTQHTITLFFIYTKPQDFIKEILIIRTRNIIKFLHMDKKLSKTCTRLYRSQRSRLNMQAFMTKKELRSISYARIRRRGFS